MESLSKLDVISVILKSSNKSCDYKELYTKLQVHLTLAQLMKFIFELEKYNLLKCMRNETSYTITPKGMYYLQIYEELSNQIRSETKTNSGILNNYIPFFKLTNFFKETIDNFKVS